LSVSRKQLRWWLFRASGWSIDLIRTSRRATAKPFIPSQSVNMNTRLHVYIFVASLFLAQALHSFSETLGNVIEIKGVEGWKSVKAVPPPGVRSPFPTAKYVPADGRNASVFITVLPNKSGKAIGLSAIKKLVEQGAAMLQPDRPSNLTVTELPVKNGAAAYTSLVDPDLLGKPPVQGNYKIASPCFIALGDEVLVQATLFSDSVDSPDFQQALQILQSISLTPRQSGPEAAAQATTVSTAGLKGILHLPANRFTPFNNELVDHPGYFSYKDDRDIILSGWLDRASAFKGMKSFWDSEKTSLETKSGLKVEEESFQVINGWSAVHFSVPMGGESHQKNVRACRVVGDTWADVHLSCTDPQLSWKDLDDTLKALSLTANETK
jgi:hypothetical protein